MVRPIKPGLKRQRNTLRQALGSVITELRTERKWSQEEVGYQAGYSSRYIIMIEKGRQNFSFDLLVAIAGVFGLSVSQLLAKAERLYRQQKTQAKS
jgi:transcriptional regulator with XRE-family HTH domain